LTAEEPGEVAVGFRETLDPAKLKEAAVSGEIESLLDWRKVKPGDVIFTPAGTVHAIGAGLTICEIQENSDITYRLYDYGRPRELHLEHGMKVSHLGPHTEESRVVALAPGRDELAESSYFRIERLRPRDGFTIAADLPQYLFAICTSGQGTFDGETFHAGEAWLIPANGKEVNVRGAGSEWIATYTAGAPSDKLRVE
jgi:mannose-6-phosphate isomerase